MEQYLWMAIGCVIVGFFVSTYWDVYQAYRAYNNTLPAEAQTTSRSPLAWLLDKGDRFLHALLMSPTSR